MCSSPVKAVGELLLNWDSYHTEQVALCNATLLLPLTTDPTTLCVTTVFWLHSAVSIADYAPSEHGKESASTYEKGATRQSSMAETSERSSNLDVPSMVPGLPLDRQPTDSRSRFMSWVSFL